MQFYLRRFLSAKVLLAAKLPGFQIESEVAAAKCCNIVTFSQTTNVFFNTLKYKIHFSFQY